MEFITPTGLGDQTFKNDYHSKYAYVVGAMYKGIASKEIVVRLGKAGLIGFLGSGGLHLQRLEEDIIYIQSHLQHGESYGMNLLCNLIHPTLENDTVELYLKYGIVYLEAAAYMQLTPALVYYRLKGLHCNAEGKVESSQHIIAKISRPEVAAIFMRPAPVEIVKKLLAAGKLTEEEARLSAHLPMAGDICVESDSGGHTDQRVALTMFPSIVRLKKEIQSQYRYAKNIRVGAAGGIGTPEAAAAYFIMGADFILTGSINQCTVEAGMSASGKDLLQAMEIQDTAYAPAGDMFELGAKVQVLKKGSLFSTRANLLYDLYRRHSSLEEIDIKTRNKIEQQYFKRSLEEVWEETKAHYLKFKPEEIEFAEKNPKHKMALIFQWYFVYSTRLALNGSSEQIVDYQIQCGSALGAFNHWVKGLPLENWQNRHVDEIANKLMQETADYLNAWFAKYQHD